MATVAWYGAQFAGYNPSGGGYEEWDEWCQAFVARASKFAGTWVRDFPTAEAAYQSNYTVIRPGSKTDRSTWQIGDIGWWAWSTQGHVAVYVGNNQFMMGSDGLDSYFGGVAGNAGVVDFDRFQREHGLAFRGVSPTQAGNVVPVELPVKAGNERQVTAGDPANGRSGPSRSNPVVQTLAGGDVGTFNGWITGENVSGNTVWFRGAIQGNYFWSGSFTDTGVHDLANLNPVVVPPTPSKSRVVTNTGGPLNIRNKPDTGGSVVKQIAEGTTVSITGYTKGLPVSGNDVWYQLDGNWAWSGGFTSQSIDGIPVVVIDTPVTPPVVVPWVPKDPQIVDLVAADFPKWIQFDTKADGDDTATVNKEAYDYYKTKGQDYQFYPIESHVHWWGDPSEGATHDSIVNYLAGKSDLSVHFVTSANRITRMVSAKRVAYTTGARSMYAWTSENDPKLTEDGYKTIGFLHYLFEKKNSRLIGENIRLHKEFMSTSCSPIDVAKVRTYANKFKSGALDPATGQAPVVTPPVVDPPVVPPVVTPTDAVKKADLSAYLDDIDAANKKLRAKLG